MTNQDTPYTLGDYLGVIRRRWIYVATILPAAVMLAVYLAYSLPPLYRSSGTILLEPSSIPEDMVRTTVTTYATEQLELVWRRVFTIDNLVGVVEEFDPYPDFDAGPRTKAQMIVQDTSTQRVDPVTMEPLEASNAFQVHYVNEDPQMAAAVTDRLVQMFLDYSRDSRTERATETVSFLRAQSEDANRRVRELDAKIAEFKELYGQALPESRDRNLNALDRAERDLSNLEQQILLKDEQKTMLELQIGQVNPHLFDPDGDWRAELAQLRANLAEARQRYTEDHPDVRRLRRSIQALQARSESEMPSEFTVPDNPRYIELQNQLQTVNQELAALRNNAATTRRQIAEFERRLDIAPGVESEYSVLVRDHELARDRLRGIEVDLADAMLARTLESEERGHRYTLIRAPGVPSVPYSPNRIGIILLGFVLGSALGGGLAALRESVDPSIRSARDLTEITDIRPLGAVPVLLNQSDRRRYAFAWAAALVVFFAALAVVASAVTGEPVLPAL